MCAPLAAASFTTRRARGAFAGATWSDAGIVVQEEREKRKRRKKILPRR
jgi:hypothetical protein